MSESTTQLYVVGDLVKPAPNAGWPQHMLNQVFVVEKVPAGARGVNYTVKPQNGVGRGARGPEDAFVPYDPDAPAPLVEEMPYIPLPDIGTLCRVKPTVRGPEPGALYVVTGYPQKRIDAVRLVKLGGENGRYWRAIPLTAIEIIDPARLRFRETMS